MTPIKEVKASRTEGSGYVPKHSPLLNGNEVFFPRLIFSVLHETLD